LENVSWTSGIGAVVLEIVSPASGIGDVKTENVSWTSGIPAVVLENEFPTSGVGDVVLEMRFRASGIGDVRMEMGGLTYKYPLPFCRRATLRDDGVFLNDYRKRLKIYEGGETEGLICRSGRRSAGARR
jgi:hypothetical protein